MYILDFFREHCDGLKDGICSEYTVKQQDGGAKMTVIVKQTKKKKTGMEVVNEENTVETYILRTHLTATHTIIRTVKKGY